MLYKVKELKRVKFLTTTLDACPRTCPNLSRSARSVSCRSLRCRSSRLIEEISMWKRRKYKGIHPRKNRVSTALRDYDLRVKMRMDNLHSIKSKDSSMISYCSHKITPQPKIAKKRKLRRALAAVRSCLLAF